MIIFIMVIWIVMGAFGGQLILERIEQDDFDRPLQAWTRAILGGPFTFLLGLF